MDGRGWAAVMIAPTLLAVAGLVLRTRNGETRTTPAAPVAGDEPGRQIAALETLDELARAYVWLHHGQPLPDPALIGAFWERTRAFATRSGDSTLIDSYFCPLVPAAVLQVRQGRRELHGIRLPAWFIKEEDTLHLVFPTAAPDGLIELIFRAYGLHAETRQTRVLLPDDSHIVMQLIFTLIRELLQVAGQRSGPSAAHPDAATAVVSTQKSSTDAGSARPTSTGFGRLPAAAPVHHDDYAPYSAVLARARLAFEGAAQRRAQTQYFLGMVIGLVLLVPITALLRHGLDVINMHPAEQDLLVAPLLIGALGAVVSVMQRMTSGNLALRYRAGRSMLAFLGGFRPLVGAVFGVLAYVLILVGLLPIRIPDTSQTMVTLVQSVVPYFLGTIAFFAGFSERFAQDMLATGQNQLTANPTTSDTPAAASTPVAPPAVLS